LKGPLTLERSSAAVVTEHVILSSLDMAQQVEPRQHDSGLGNHGNDDKDDDDDAT
jgi:hypothetical protein